MDIKLQNVGEDRALQVKGPRMEVVLSDAGQANVAMALSLQDGTHFHCPLPGTPDAPQSTLLPSGRYTCVLQITAIDLNFGRTFRARSAWAGPWLPPQRARSRTLRMRTRVSGSSC